MGKELAVVERVNTEILLPIEAQIKSALPATVDMRRFQSAFIIAFQREPKLFTCTPESIRDALIDCASDGLVPDGRMAALVPFRDGSNMVAQYFPMYQGIISRARELGDVISFTAEVVHKNDQFDPDRSDPSKTPHFSPPLNEPRGDIVGAYCIFRDGESRVIHREIMDLGQINEVRAVSKAKNSPAWAQWFGEMARKTVLRRGSKWVPMSDSLRKIIEREDKFVAFERSERPEKDPNYNPLLAASGRAAKTSTTKGGADEEVASTASGNQPGAGSGNAAQADGNSATNSSRAVADQAAAGQDAAAGGGPEPQFDILAAYSAALFRVTSTLAALKHIDGQFWKKNAPPADGSTALIICQKIFGLHQQRLESTIDSDACREQIGKLIGGAP